MRRTTALMITALTVGGLVSCSEDEQTSSTTQDQTTVAVEDETTTTADATEEGNVMEVVDDAGVRTAVIVTPVDPSPDESIGGCVPAADAGQTNIRFGMLVGPSPTSAADRRTVAVPHVEFRLNLDDDGQSVDPKATNFDSARYTDVEARADGQCEDMNAISPGRVPWADSIGVGQPLAFPLTAGPTTDPPPEGIVLYVRFFASADGDVTDLAVRYDP